MSQAVHDAEEQTIAHFCAHGWMRVAHAFDTEAAKAMRDAIWRVLAMAGIQRDDRETWTVERPPHLQKLKYDPVFRTVGSDSVLTTIDEILEGQLYDAPKDWGAHFIAFPRDAEWIVPTGGWHIDAKPTGALWPATGVKTFALLGDVVPRGGGTLMVGGSHRLVHRWFQDNPPPEGARNAELRKLLKAHPYIRDLHGAGDRDQRIERFIDRPEELEGIPLQVVEMTGKAGDVFLMHPLVMHVASTNKAAEPRFLLSGGITTDMWGWGSP